MEVAPDPKPRTEVVIGIVFHDVQVLICRRPSHATFPGHWEFPGGKREAGETLEQCLLRELDEELGITVRPVALLERLDHDYPTGRIRLHPYLCALVAGEPRPLASDEVRWVDPSRLPEYRFPPANGPLLARVLTIDFPSNDS